MTPYAPVPSQPIPSYTDNSSFNPSSNAGLYGQPAPQMYQPTPAASMVPQVPNPPMNPTPMVPASLPPIEPAQPAVNYQAEAPPGWNDPPVVNRPTRPQVSVFKTNLYFQCVILVTESFFGFMLGYIYTIFLTV